MFLTMENTQIGRIKPKRKKLLWEATSFNLIRKILDFFLMCFILDMFKYVLTFPNLADKFFDVLFFLQRLYVLHSFFL